jgi:GNAT superfamily N-acetyltransferase
MENPTNVISLRPATHADERALHALIEASVRGLQRNDYTPEQIEGALGTLLGLDTQLVEDGTYFVAEARAACARIIVGCGGWSHRKTLFGSDHAPVRENDFLDPATDAAKIRAFFIHPDWARRGIGSKILEACESAARAAGFWRFEMGATLTGVPLYLARGYHILERIEVPLHNGVALPIVRMAKSDTEPVPK